MNSEGIPHPGPGSNCKGLKHRIRPPLPEDSYIPEGKKNDRSVFLFDSPYQIIPSLFRRKIAVGHAVAITGKRPNYDNDLDMFLSAGIDSFGFAEQFDNWCDARREPGYHRMLVRASLIWSHLPELLDYLGIPADAKPTFPAMKNRNSSFEQLSAAQQIRMEEIYGDLNRRILSYKTISVI
jgi:hypothetical protein